MELIDECAWVWKSIDGVNGYEVAGKNGNSIFLPATGFKMGRSDMFRNEMGNYWSSSFCEQSKEVAYRLHFRQDRSILHDDVIDKCYGLYIRPVFSNHI